MTMLYKVKYDWLVCLLICCLSACGGSQREISVELDWTPALFPDYVGVTIPCNIAPLNFSVEEEGDQFVLQATVGEQTATWESHGNRFDIPESDWQELLEVGAGRELQMTILRKQCGKWERFQPFTLTVAQEPVDAYLAYRLIEPGYSLWNRMGIYQRDLTCFNQTPIYENKMGDFNCVNCHSFCQQTPDRMLLHMRSSHGGTYFSVDGKQEKIEVPKWKDFGSLVYPYWHPDGRYVAFSMNKTTQDFHPTQRVEVFDFKSDVVVYDREAHQLLTSPWTTSDEAFETFPTFSPDGRSLYFCSAPARPMPDSITTLRYHLCRIDFDADKGTFGEGVDTLYNIEEKPGSILFPRISPDGRFLLCTRTAYGTFPIWHKDADLWMFDLQRGEEVSMEDWNSDDTDSYHSWSSNSRWVVFSSRRMDGLYTRPFLAYVGPEGQLGKPFLLPQQDPACYYPQLMKSFNVPEFIRGKVERRHFGSVESKK
ncbi:MAG: hypothetical protein ACI30I_02745 [Parabacteroides sp.]